MSTHSSNLWLKKLAASLLSVLTAVLAAELLIRATGAAPEVSVIRKGRFQLSRNPKIGYEPAPLDYQGEDLSFYDYLGKSNRLGYRDVDHDTRKPPGVYRIVVLGDSIGAGLRVDRYEDVFPPILEKLLRVRGVNAEVINFSVSGYNTQQEVETLKDRGLAYQPDLVLVAYSLNDRERVDGNILKTLLDTERQTGTSATRVNPYVVRSALYRFFKYRVADPAPEQAAAASDRELADLSGDTVAESFADLARVSRQHHFDVLVAVFPRLVRDFQRYRFGDQHQFVAGLCEKDGFHRIDLLETFIHCREASDLPIGEDNAHPSAYGHHCAAEALADTILREIRPPGEPRPYGRQAYREPATARAKIAWAAGLGWASRGWTQ
jgi:lysophospholipase L1-like esterase